MKTTNWILCHDVFIQYGPQDLKKVPAGSFVSPVKFEYLPPHIKNDKQWLPFNEERDVYCYTRHGFIKVEKKDLRAT